ncbi:hypothetical protein C4D60_Mb07t14450 [Musa balbisiana]|uniref:Uncharacterized protein n=1 Tax=Musa balbisiana TaxID=52838 RepID=A0A4S8JFA1_MUSBA|nr:hypothetical protein C4D60_Mb07t14450 [Musa balbisiana]
MIRVGVLVPHRQLRVSASVEPYLPGRGRRANKKARGLGQWPPLHFGGALAYHLPKRESGRHNLTTLRVVTISCKDHHASWSSSISTVHGLKPHFFHWNHARGGSLEEDCVGGQSLLPPSPPHAPRLPPAYRLSSLTLFSIRFSPEQEWVR